MTDRRNPVYLVAVAASVHGVEGLRRDGVFVDAEAFDLAVRLVATLAKFFEPDVLEELVGRVPMVGEVRNSSDDGLMTTTDVAQIADVSDRAVRKAAGLGQLAGAQDGSGRWLFTRQAVEEWMSR